MVLWLRQGILDVPVNDDLMAIYYSIEQLTLDQVIS